MDSPELKYTNSMAETILTGLRANNSLHLGNYLGALLPIVDMAKQHSDNYQVNLFMPDLHSFTTPIDHDALQGQIMAALRVFVAAGLPLDNPNIHIYRQSYIPAHSELTVILNSFTGFGEMFRMTQFKEKGHAIFQKVAREHSGFVDSVKVPDDTQEHINMVVHESNKRTTVGLFDYPVLMAADILLYGASYVPVGDDQTQHLEFTRDIAERMNNKFGELFVVPKSVKKQHQFFGKDQGLRIKDLADPTKKMSKSDETGKGVIFLDDAPEQAAKKIKSATTDNLAKINRDYDNQPGISNLLDIYELFGGAVSEFEGQDKYGPLKEAVATKVSDFLNEFQTAVGQVDEKMLQAKLVSSEKQMSELANQTLLKVQKAVGLRA